jgi:hypothetical protein
MSKILGMLAAVALLVPATSNDVFAHGFPAPVSVTVPTAGPGPGPGPGPGTSPGNRGPAAGRRTPRLGSGRTTPSPARLARTTMKWLGGDLPMKGGEGYAAQALPISSLLADEFRPAGAQADVPSIVYFASAADDKQLQRFEAQAFGDERIGVSSRFFNCFRFTLEDLPPAQQKLYGDGTEGPKVLLLDKSGSVVKTFDGWKTDSSKIFRSMKVMVKVAYEKDLAGILPKEGKILDTLDKAHYELTILDAQRKVVAERLAKKECQSCRKVLGKLESKIEKMKAEREQALVDEKKLLGDD